MDFTREPMIETVITPREGFKLVVRSSKGVGQEEYFVDSIEVVNFGQALFFRSMEKPKSFLVPTSDYEILEVREARMILKNVGVDRSIKIAGGREGNLRGNREPIPERSEPEIAVAEKVMERSEAVPAASEEGARTDKKRDRRTRHRRRRGRDEKEDGPKEGADLVGSAEGERKEDTSQSTQLVNSSSPEVVGSSSSVIASLLPPPSTLISETIARYKDNALFKGAFYSREEVETVKESSEESDREGKDREGKDRGYPSLDIIDEAIDHSARPAEEPAEGLTEEEPVEKPEALDSELQKDSLWDFSEDVHGKE